MEIIKFGHEVLHQPTDPVEDIDEEVRPFLADMFKTMTIHDGIGLAANQVGVAKSFFVFLCNELTGVVINPRVVHVVGSSSSLEGCLSGSSERLLVKRPEVIVVEYQILDGSMVSQMFSGSLATLFCHEIDHLNGLTIRDRCKQNFG